MSAPHLPERAHVGIPPLRVAPGGTRTLTDPPGRASECREEDTRTDHWVTRSRIPRSVPFAARRAMDT
jgi:hypothetical protein